MTVDGDYEWTLVTDRTAPDASLRASLRTIGLPRSVNLHLDGGWWPRSFDLAAELPELLGFVQDAGFDAHRVIYRLSNWQKAPRRLTFEHAHRVSLSGYERQPDDTVALVSGSGRERLEILVIAPDAEPDAAAQALQIAGTTGDPDTAARVLARATAVR